LPETELFDDDVINAVTFDEAEIPGVMGADNDMNVEATQPLILTPVILEDLRLAYLISCTVSKLFKFSLARGECLTLTLSLVVIPCQYRRIT